MDSPIESPSLDGRGEGRVKNGDITPTLILPHRGGGGVVLRRGYSSRL